MMRSAVCGLLTLGLAVSSSMCLEPRMAPHVNGPGGGVNRYWSWGWGLYGLSDYDRLDSARYDWTLVTVGDHEDTDRATLAACNEILRLNPEHRFVIRTWPILALGQCPENDYQATMFDYLYAPGVKAEVLDEARRELTFFLHGIARPDNIVGATFLEELPAHFTSAPFGPSWASWKPGDPLPWDIRRFDKEITADLGEPFDLTNPRHLSWWGAKYEQVLGEIHRAMREVLGDRSILYYGKTGLLPMDVPASRLRTVDRMPIRYANIVGPGGADGIFAYANDASIWREEAEAPSQALNCLLFSQISLPGAMRLTTLDDQVALTRWPYRGNLGAFVYAAGGRKSGAWNDPPYQGETFWTARDHVRRFAWDRRIHTDLVDRALSPTIELRYDVSRLRTDGVARVWLQLWNPRTPSWYGGDADRATIRRVTAALEVEGGLVSMGEPDSANRRVGDLGPSEGRLLDWTIRGGGTPGVSLPVFPVSARVEGDGVHAEVVSETLRSDWHQTVYRLARSGESWPQVFSGSSPWSVVIALSSLGSAIDSPGVGAADRRTVVTYHGILRPNSRLLIGPGGRATIVFTDPFSKDDESFVSRSNGRAADGMATPGYLLFGTAPARVLSGERYRLTVTGRATGGGDCQVALRFSGAVNGKREDKDVTLGTGGFREQLSEVELPEFVVPEFDGGESTMTVYFYRARKTGSVSYASFRCRRVDVPADGVDVSGAIEGSVGDLAPGLTVWTYIDHSDPLPDGGPKVEVRVLPADEVLGGAP